MKIVSIIRDRGQLTIPDPVRQIVGWATPLSAVTISVMTPDEIIIRPHVQSVDHAKIWEKIRKSRAITGKGSMSGGQFLEADRFSH